MSKPQTILEIINRAKGYGYPMSANAALAAIETIIAEQVIGLPESCTELCEDIGVCHHTYNDRLRAQQRSRLKKVMGGGE